MSTSSENPNLPLNLDGLRWLYKELLRIEQHWTDQDQDQQQRISTLLAVTGILLAFLAGAGFLGKLLEVPTRNWPVYVYIASMISLCCSLFIGTSALRPKIPIAGTFLPGSAPAHSEGTQGQAKTHALRDVRNFLLSLAYCFRPAGKFPRSDTPLWLDQSRVLEDAKSHSEEDLLRALCENAVENKSKADFENTLKVRRLLMYRQLTFMMLSLFLLIVALVGVLATPAPAVRAEDVASSSGHRPRQ